MIVSFVITSFEGKNTGLGGHYYSCLALAKALNSAGHRVIIFCVGDKLAPALQNEEVEVKRIECKARQLREGIKLLTQALSEFNPDVVHAFNQSAYFLARFPCKRLRLPIVLTKPGGAFHEGAYHPLVGQFIVFTRDDYEGFSRSKRFKNASIHWIPNRVTAPELNEERVRSIKQKLEGEVFTFLLISRISMSKTDVFQQAVRMVRELKSRHLSFRLLIIGTPDSLSLKNWIEGQELSEIILLTEKPYIVKASDYIPFADCVIAMGRGVMEAAAWGKPVLVPSQPTKPFPVLLTDDTFESSFRANFTERAVFPFNAGQDLSAVEQLVADISEHARASAFMKACYREYFDISAKVDLYTDIYRQAVPYDASYRWDEWRHRFILIVLGQVRYVINSFKGKYKKIR